MCALVAKIFRGIVDHGNSLRLDSLLMRQLGKRAKIVKTFCLLVSPVLHFVHLLQPRIIIKWWKSNCYKSSVRSFRSFTELLIIVFLSLNTPITKPVKNLRTNNEQMANRNRDIYNRKRFNQYVGDDFWIDFVSSWIQNFTFIFHNFVAKKKCYFPHQRRHSWNDRTTVVVIS